MKSKKFFAGIAIAIVAVIGLSSFTTAKGSQSTTTADLHTHVAAQGAHCNGTVGCGCSGFSPITGQEVWKSAYCKHCGHHRSNHR